MMVEELGMIEVGFDFAQLSDKYFFKQVEFKKTPTH
jgi:hypothetical protein